MAESLRFRRLMYVRTGLADAGCGVRTGSILAGWRAEVTAPNAARRAIWLRSWRGAPRYACGSHALACVPLRLRRRSRVPRALERAARRCTCGPASKQRPTRESMRQRRAWGAALQHAPHAREHAAPPYVHPTRWTVRSGAVRAAPPCNTRPTRWTVRAAPPCNTRPARSSRRPRAEACPPCMRAPRALACLQTRERPRLVHAPMRAPRGARGAR